MKTPLFDRHLSLKARMIDFFGWELPLVYSSTLDEWSQVRQKAALFDVSHMLRIDIEGEEAEAFLDKITTNKLKKENGSVTYTLITNSHGTIVDDTLISRKDKNHFFMVANGSRREADLAFLNHFKGSFKVNIFPREGCIIALQGPESERYFPPMTPFTFREENGIVISSTGYTGEKGFEFLGPSEKILPLWDDLIQKVKPAGLGARDILRLEKGYALYGHELNETLMPKETISAWAAKEKDYLGKSLDEPRFNAVGIQMDSKACPREDFPVFHRDNKIGKVTSGGFSPTLQKAIALALIQTKLPLGEEVFVEIRGRQEKGRIVKTPFI